MPSDSTRGGRGGRGGRGDHIRVVTRSCNQKLDFHPAADPTRTTPVATPAITIPHPTLTTTTPLPTPTTSHTTPTTPSGPDGPLHPPEAQAARSTANKRVRVPTFRTVESTRRPGTPLPTPTNSSITPLPTSTTPVATPAITIPHPTLTTTTPLPTPTPTTTPTTTTSHTTPTTTTSDTTPTTPSDPDGPLHPPEAQAARSATNKRVRGPTFHTVESTRRPGDGPFRAEFFKGRAITQEFITSVGVWIRDIPPTAGNFDDLPIEHREALFQRIADNFELVELDEVPALDNPAGRRIVVRTTPGASSSRSPPTLVGQTSGATAAAGDNSIPPKKRDPTLILPCSPGTRIVTAGECRDRWRKYMSKLRAKYFDCYATFDERIAHHPPEVDPDDWKSLVTHWSTESYGVKRVRNSINRSFLDMLPTIGSRPFVAHRKDIVEKTGLPVHEGKFFEQTRKRKDGSFSDEKAKKAVEAMVVMEEQHTQEDGSCSIDTSEILAAVVGPDKKGRKRLHGRTEPKSRCGSIPQAMLQSLREEMQEQMQEVNRQLEARVREAREEARREAREEARREREAYQNQFPESVQAALAMLLASLPPQLRVPPSSGSQPGAGNNDRSIGDGGRQ